MFLRTRTYINDKEELCIEQAIPDRRDTPLHNATCKKGQVCSHAAICPCRTETMRVSQ